MNAGLTSLEKLRRHADDRVRVLVQIHRLADDVGAAGKMGLPETIGNHCDGRATGVDIWQAEDLSGNSQQATLENARREGVADRVEVRTGDARELPFADKLFDVVVSSMALQVNYRGPNKAAQVWTFEVRDTTTGSWVSLGDNAFAADWIWTMHTFAFPAPLARYFSGTTLQIRYGTTSTVDASDVDQMLITGTR